MPELPEVQTVLDTLKLKIKESKIVGIKVLYQPIIDGISVPNFKKALLNQTFKEFKRRGKYLLFIMDDLILVSHLRMEGKYFIKKKDEEIDKHTHIIFNLDNGYDLRYNDVRKFGRMEIINKNYDLDSFKNLGPEPLSNNLTFEYVKSYLSKQKTPMKTIMLDQSFIAGIGNIYADEILFLSSINPLEMPNRINDKEIKLLIKSTKDVLKKAIKDGGTTIRSYTSSLGVTGRFQTKLNVHTKDICPKCGNKIKKIKVGGRGTYYCEVCQQLKKRIAITGTIGSGKTTVSNLIRNKGFDVFDCDEYNAKLLNENTYVIDKIKKYFKECVINNKIEKDILRKIILNDSKKRIELENILHPLIIEEMLKEANETKIFFAEVPLLFEKGLEKYFDKTLLITCDKEIAIKRLIKRGVDEKTAKKFIKNQMSVKEKIKRADEIIYNNSNCSSLKKSVINWLKYVR